MRVSEEGRMAEGEDEASEGEVEHTLVEAEWQTESSRRAEAPRVERIARALMAAQAGSYTGILAYQRLQRRAARAAAVAQGTTVKAQRAEARAAARKAARAAATEREEAALAALRVIEARGSSRHATAVTSAVATAEATATEATWEAAQSDPCAFIAEHTIRVPWAFWGGEYESSRRRIDGRLVGGVGSFDGDRSDVSMEVRVDDRQHVYTLWLTWEQLCGEQKFGVHQVGCQLQRRECSGEAEESDVGARELEQRERQRALTRAMASKAAAARAQAAAMAHGAEMETAEADDEEEDRGVSRRRQRVTRRLGDGRMGPVAYRRFMAGAGARQEDGGGGRGQETRGGFGVATGATAVEAKAHAQAIATRTAHEAAERLQRNEETERRRRDAEAREGVARAAAARGDERTARLGMMEEVASECEECAEVATAAVVARAAVARDVMTGGREGVAGEAVTGGFAGGGAASRQLVVRHRPEFVGLADYVYVGPVTTGSPGGDSCSWGHVHSVRRQLRSPRQRSLEHLVAVVIHKRWLLAQPAEVLRARRQLVGRRLGCWCRPLACHGDTLAALANCPAAELRRHVEMAGCLEMWQAWAAMAVEADAVAMEVRCVFAVGGAAAGSDGAAVGGGDSDGGGGGGGVAMGDGDGFLVGDGSGGTEEGSGDCGAVDGDGGVGGGSGGDASGGDAGGDGGVAAGSGDGGVIADGGRADCDAVGGMALGDSSGGMAADDDGGGGGGGAVAAAGGSGSGICGEAAGGGDGGARGAVGGGRGAAVGGGAGGVLAGRSGDGSGAGSGPRRSAGRQARPITWTFETNGNEVKCKRCGRQIRRAEPRVRQYQAAGMGYAFANTRWHVQCVKQEEMGRIRSGNMAVYQQLRAAQEEEQQRQQEERNAAERWPMGQMTMRGFLRRRRPAADA